MAVEAVYRSRIRCDGGCGSSVESESASAAREAGKKEGWTFPPMRLASGRPAKRVHHVCPNCADSFRPTMSPRSSEYDGMCDEERRLTVFLKMHWNVVSEEERARLRARRAELQQAREAGQ